MTTTLTTIAQVRDFQAPTPPARRAVVMTMGALHSGHLSLVSAARTAVGTTGQVLVTIFVNPLQFGDSADLQSYPRTLDADLAACREAGVDAVFAPNAGQMYPNGEPQTRVAPGLMAEDLEGAARPGHFSGMLTVVLKLLAITSPDVAFFGEKDYQQLMLIKQMVADFNLDVEVVGVPTCREPDGLAMSSRNTRLSDAARGAALCLHRALAAGQSAAANGGDGQAVLAAAHAKLPPRDPDAATHDPSFELDYLALRGVDLGPAPVTGPARLLVAANVAGVRLLDNAPVLLVAQAGEQ